MGPCAKLLGRFEHYKKGPHIFLQKGATSNNGMQIFCTTFCILLYVPPITTYCKFIFFHFKLWLIYKESSIMHTQNIWLLGITSTWAHNLFVLWAFRFPTVGGSILGIPKYTSISSRLSLFLTESLICSFWVFTLFS